MDDLDRLIARPDPAPPGVEVQPMGRREYGLRAPGVTAPVRVTTDRAYHADNADSVEFRSPGNPLFQPPTPLRRRPRRRARRRGRYWRRGESQAPQRIRNGR